MPEKRRQYEQEFKEGAVRIVRESGKSIAEIARDLDINAGTLGNWVARTAVNVKAPKGFPPTIWPS
jgi:transposase